MKLPAMPWMPVGDGLGHDALGQAAGFHAQVEAGGSVTPGWLR